MYKLQVTKEIKKAKQKYYGAIIEKSIHKSRVLWKNLKEFIFNKKSNKEGKIYLKINNNLIESPTEVADTFNEYFIDVITNSTSNLNAPTVLDLSYLNYDVTQCFGLTETSVDEINKIIQDLKKDAATGYDHISTKFLQMFSNILSPRLTYLINNVFRTGYFPSSLKKATVIPVYKSGNATNVENYRPISVLSSISKVVEKILLNRLDLFLQNNNLISQRQFGFSKNSNTTAACLELTNYISKKVDEKRFVSCVFLDLKRAFDSVDHSILLMKLKKMQFDTLQIQLFESYLRFREQTVSIDGKKSVPKIIKSGVPQGSILGPSLFRIFINDMTNIELNGHLILYADDAVIIYDNSNFDVLHDEMECDLIRIKSWLDINLLLLNVKKTKYIVFKNKVWPDISASRLKYGSEIVERVDEFLYLGLKIDSKIKWNLHVEKVKKSITPYIFAIRKSRNILPKKVLTIMYNSYILSHIMYLNPIWSACAAFRMNELFVLQKRVVKYILHVPIRYPTNLLFNDESKFLSLPKICKRELLILMFKVINNHIMHNFDLTRIGDTHNHNTRRISHYRTDFFSSSARNNNVFYRGVIEFNKLSRDLRREKNISVYKRGITHFIGTNE